MSVKEFLLYDHSNESYEIVLFNMIETMTISGDPRALFFDLF